VRLLIDENLPPRLASLLTGAGHEALHVRDLDAAGASDPQIVELALAEQRVIISADTDFGALLAQARTGSTIGHPRPQVVDHRPTELARLLVAHIARLRAQLDAGRRDRADGEGTNGSGGSHFVKQ
jgi:predicted nuclease of predicted toxin-antitoxin system